MKSPTVIFGLALLAMGCSPVSKNQLAKTVRATEQKFQHHAGFVLYDPAGKRTLFTYNGERYFTPASNTKIFTLYAALSILGDSVPGFQYVERGDSLIIFGTGDPSFLYPYTYTNSVAYDFLHHSQRDIYYAERNFNTTPLGPGWAWSDYLYSYSVERSQFPVYGNFFSVSRDNGKRLTVSPAYFKKYFWLADSTHRSEVMREIGSNRTEYFPGRTQRTTEKWEVPFKPNPVLVADLLGDTLKRKVRIVSKPLTGEIVRRTLFTVPTDSVLKSMMQQSDNFIAEQMLLMCAQALSDTLKTEIAIRYMKANRLADLPDVPVWVDGSGLSRYNLFTPRSIVKLWEKIEAEAGRERVLPLLAVGGKSGTIRNWYKADVPYIYGKTGTLSNNHSLSGYLITKKGRTLIFSFMNSNFTVPVNEVRREMEVILKRIHDNY
ncbi:D-alanyl-D-alanine carboxypeptidase [Oscillatoria amoena NRMC-F 0135]|nr:D-alanyl-D-alanine carboxypeptidase [Oscillatoria amoena NRMC-F 0135]